MRDMRESFDLCLSDVVDDDYKIGAKDVTALINAACTSGGLYTTQFATPDQSKGTCWSNGPIITAGSNSRLRQPALSMFR